MNHSYYSIHRRLKWPQQPLQLAQLHYLAPYLLKPGQTLAEQAIDDLPKGVGKFWNYILEKFQGKLAAEEAANDPA